MSLPPSEELSRWTVSQVSNWLAKCSLAAFRDDFLRDSIDGSKLLRMSEDQVNQKYKHINQKKRNILTDQLRRIESSRQLPTWNTAPSVPPRYGGNSRPPMEPPCAPPYDSDGSEDGWDEDFDDEDDADDYLEPASKPLIEPSGYHTNGNMPAETEETYEIPAEDLAELRQPLQRKPTIAEKLRDELHRKKNSENQLSPGPPPPRPPRSGKVQGGVSPRSMSPSHRDSPMPIPTQAILPPDDTYEVMNDVMTETQRNAVQPFQPSEPEESLPPRPAKRGDNNRPPEPQPEVHTPPSQRARQPYTEVKKPGRTVQDELSVYPWYHGKIGRDHAQRIFEREQQDGMFLIRKSERDPSQPYTLVIWHVNRIWNLPIRKKDNGNFAAGKYKDGETEFSSVPELVEHFKVVSLSLKSNATIKGTHTLTVPAPKN